MMKTVSSVTKVLVGVVVAMAVPYTVSAAMVGNEERQAAREASMEERKADRAAGME
jgi:mannitol-specific phosphotransferase system IIBC component